jgi:hypothetical protein
MPATTRIVGIGVLCSASTISFTITHLPLFTPFVSIESLCVRRASCIKKPTTIITQNRKDSARSAWFPTQVRDVVRGLQRPQPAAVWRDC